MASNHWLDDLPPRLEERVRRIDGNRTVPAADDGAFVMYWMRTACRGHENPALDTAIAAANRLGVPAFIYHGLSESYAYASDRLHTFILEGARDVRREAADRGVGYALHVERPGQRGPHLKTLANRASLVITEDMPIPLLSDWTQTIHDQTSPPLFLVDTSCIVPMRLVDSFHDRAYKFRRATESMRDTRIDREWPPVSPDHASWIPDDLPFEPVDPQTADIPELIASCDIDHGIGPVPHTTGGSQAGYDRWREFVDDGLEYYHKRRNDPTDYDGASRMSAYLHFGQVSPFRLAREAAAHDSRGADKYIDELITWRELAHHFAFNDPDIGTVDSLPDWAIETLRDHEDDPRDALYDWETLAGGETDSELWNLCQTSLLAHGELHNNVRMTWAKQLLKWTPDIETALDYAIDLNHRYALDGRDPNSYLGIQWVYGAFDKPYDADRDIIGCLRRRDTSWHSSQIDMEDYSSLVGRSPGDPSPSVAIIGAGIAGLTAARALADHNLDVQVFDKGRGPGGRSSTRHARSDKGQFDFDHGAQYFTARHPVFRRFVDAWLDQDVIREWSPRLAVIDEDGARLKQAGLDDESRDADSPQRFVGVPGMNELNRHLQRPDATDYRREVEAIEPVQDRWALETTDGNTSRPFDVVITTAPPVQSAHLLRHASPSLSDQCRDIDMRPTWATMLAFDGPLELDFDAAFVNTGPLSWVAHNASKPGRDDAHTWVLHADHEWAKQHLELEADDITARLTDAFFEVTGLDDRADSLHDNLLYSHSHRWRYAAPPAQTSDDANPPGSLVDDERRLIACGDWTHGSRIEGAFLAGRHAAGRTLRQFHSAGTDSQLELM
jgi:photolyase PhrII